MIGLILAAGNGTRIKKITGKNNKCILPIEGKTIIAQTVENLLECREINKIIVVISSTEEEIQKELSVYKDKIQIEYLIQQEARGILAAIALCYEKVKEEDVFLSLGDEYFKKPKYKEMIEKYYDESYDIILGTLHTKNEEAIKNNYAVILDSNGNISNLIEKPTHIENDLLGTGSIIFHGQFFSEIKNVPINPKRKEADLVGLILLAIKEKKKVINFDLACTYTNINSKQQLLECYSHSGYYPKERNIVDLFREQVESKRNEVAIVCEDKQVTYLELDELSERVAYSLRQEIGAKNGVIGILLPRSIEYIVTLVGVLKAGYTYIPLDVIYPVERIEYMLMNAKADGFVTHKKINNMSLKEVKEWEYNAIIEGKMNSSKKEEVNIEPLTRAYIMYTSGSTGKPKGAQITHKNILNMVWGLKKEIYDMYPEKRLNIGVVATFVFDMSAQQIYPSLLFGHTLYILPEGWNRDAKKVLEFFETNKIDISDGTPVLLNMINNILIKEKTNCMLRHFVVGGEVLPNKSVATYFKYHPLGRITNIYGPTECCVEATTYYLDQQIIKEEPQVFIGKPMNNIRIYILNEKQEMVKANECGEIYIAGDCVGLGYINNKDLTEQAFLPDILADGCLMYKTGDLGRWGKNGNVVYIGRKDKQVKIRGYRVELGEIEQALERLAYIEGAKVLVRQNEDKNMIVAYIQVRQPNISAARISEELSSFLPHYMIPALYVPVESFPKNINGKVDVEALKSYKLNFLRSIDKEVVRNEEEQFILESVQDILNVEAPQPIENFMLLGGDSLSLIKLLDKIEQQWHLGISILEVKETMTLREIADVIKRKRAYKTDEIEVQSNKKVKCLTFQEHLLNIEQQMRVNGNEKKLNIMRYLIPLVQPLDYERFEQAFKETINNNDAFKLKFESRGKKYWVRLGEEAKFLGVIREVNSVALEDLMCIQSLVDIKNQILIEYQILKKDKREILMLSIHHAVFDYLSFYLFMDELETRYLKKVYPKRIGTPFIGYMRQQSKMIGIDDIEEEEKCKVYVNNISPVGYDIRDKKIEGFKLNRVYKNVINVMENTLLIKIREFCKVYHVSEYITLLAVFMRNLARRSGEEKITIGLFNDGRGRLKKANTIGFFTKFVYYNFYNKEESLLQTISRVKDDIEEIRQNSGRYDVVELGQKYKDIPIVYVVFDYQKLMNNFKGEDRIWDFAYSADYGEIEYIFVLRIFDYGEQCTLKVQYANDVYLKNDIESYLEEYIGALQEI